MSEQLPTREQALQLLRQSGCRENVVRHVEAVSALAVRIAEAIRDRGHPVNIELVEIGALLHDIGRSKTHAVHHSIVGAKIAESFGLPERVISIIKKHVGGGISARDARKLGWPKDDYIPRTVEEKVVCYADKLVEGSSHVPIEETIDRLSFDLPPASIKRLWKLHDELLSLAGDFGCLF